MPRPVRTTLFGLAATALVFSGCGDDTRDTGDDPPAEDVGPGGADPEVTDPESGPQPTGDDGTGGGTGEVGGGQGSGGDGFGDGLGEGDDLLGDDTTDNQTNGQLDDVQE